MTITAQKGEIGFGLQYTKFGSGTLAATSAKGKITFTANVANTNTVTIGGTTYTFKTALTPTANEVLLGATATASASNLAAAIMADAGSGTLYAAGTTANATVTGVAENQTVFLTVITAGSAGNSTTLSKSATNLTLTAFAGGLGAGAYDLTTIPWSRHVARDIDYDAQNMQSVLPLEIGGPIVPKGAYKSGVAVGGGMSLEPRLENGIGNLLLAAFGTATTTTDSPEAGANTHVFKYDATQFDEIPWVAVRKAIPGRGAIRGKGVVGYDNKLVSMRLTVPQSAPLETRVDFIGRVPKFDNYPESWTVTNDYEDFKSLPISCNATFTLPTISTNPQPVTQVVVDLVNSTTGPQQEMIVGSYFMDDIAVLTRAMTVRFMYKWYDPELYERSMGNALNITDWDPAPFFTEKSGGNYAFQIDAMAPFVIGATATKYKLTIRATKCYWEPVGPVTLQAGGIVMQQYRGTVLQPTSPTAPYAEFILINAASGYSIPVAP